MYNQAVREASLIRSRKMKDLKHFAIAIVLGLALLAQLMNPTRAYADGETPPQPSETPVETSTSEPTEAAVTESATPDPLSSTPEPIATDPAITMSTEVAASESPTADPGLITPVPTEVTPTDAAVPTVESVETITSIPPTDSPEPTAEPAASTPDPVATPTPEETAQAEEPMLGEVLQEISGDTTVIVLDENGQSEPLATQAAADILASSDPMWCPDGVPPGGFGCTPNFISMADLLAFAGSYINSQNVNGTIWITAGPVTDVNPVVIDGSAFTNWANYGLNLQGGWRGFFGDTSIVSNSVFSTSITIANWNNTVFMGNITASTVNIDNPDSIVILADVTANNTNINNPKGRIDVYNSTGNLNINNADINNNGLYSAGVNIHSLFGDVTISNSVFHGNGYDGIWMNNVNNVTIDNSLFYQNANNGIGIYNAANVSIINNSLSSANGGNGVAIEGATNITITNGTFNDNLFHGIYVANTTGNITLANITATADPATTYGDGAYLDNTWGSGNITVSGTNDFSNHNPWNSGMFIISNGNVSLSGITSNNNGRGINVSKAGKVSITNGTFSGNAING